MLISVEESKGFWAIFTLLKTNTAKIIPTKDEIAYKMNRYLLVMLLTSILEIFLFINYN